MNQKLKAGLITAGILAITVVATLAIQLAATYITPEMIPFILTAAGMGLCIYVMYSLILTQIRDQDEIKSMIDKK